MRINVSILLECAAPVAIMQLVRFMSEPDTGLDWDSIAFGVYVSMMLVGTQAIVYLNNDHLRNLEKSIGVR